jgi:hypothetical protein
MLIPIYECQNCFEQVITKTECPYCGSKNSMFMYYTESAVDVGEDLCPECHSEICVCFEE